MSDIISNADQKEKLHKELGLQEISAITANNDEITNADEDKILNEFYNKGILYKRP